MSLYDKMDNIRGQSETDKASHFLQYNLEDTFGNKI